MSNRCAEISAVVVQSPTAVDCCHSNVLFVAAAEHWLTSVGGRVGYLMSIWSAPIVIHNSTSIPLMLPIITPSKRRPHRWYFDIFDFQLPSEMLVKRVPNSRGNLQTVKTYSVISIYRRNLVTLNVYLVHTVINYVRCVSFVYVFHLVKFVFCCYRIILVNKDIMYVALQLKV